MTSQGELRPTRRFITTLDAAGRSVFSTALQEAPPLTPTSTGMRIGFCYATQYFPVQMDQGKDIQRYSQFIKEPPGIVVPDGTAARIADFPPGFTSAMHRTISINYNFVIEGEVEITLDSGETRVLRPGDVVVQRAINHAWRNTSDTKWARIAAVSFPAATMGMAESGTEGIVDTKSH